MSERNFKSWLVEMYGSMPAGDLLQRALNVAHTVFDLLKQQDEVSYTYTFKGRDSLGPDGKVRYVEDGSSYKITIRRSAPGAVEMTTTYLGGKQSFPEIKPGTMFGQPKVLKDAEAVREIELGLAKAYENGAVVKEVR